MDDWSSGSNSNIINVTTGTTGGAVIANEVNSCANLKDTIQVTAIPPQFPAMLQAMQVFVQMVTAAH